MSSIAGYIATATTSLVVGVLLIRLQPRAKVKYWSPHSFLFNLTKENVVLQTDALTVQNVGRSAAKTVEIVFDAQPDFFQFSPAVTYTQATTAAGHFVLTLATLGPNEFFTLQVLSYTKVPQALNIRSDAGQAEFMPFQIQRVFPAWVNVLIASFMLLGAGFALYWVVRAVIYLSVAIGVG